jgi:pSer/pThr/pTyr-binding forkhead associated (FHA) protein
MEDGEIYDRNTLAYDEGNPSFGGRDSRSPSNSPAPDRSQGSTAITPPRKDGLAVAIRFLVIRTSILSRKLKLAILDGYPELQFGRDVAPAGTDTPRIRLKEMEVSKVHATVYWDSKMREWAVVDMGSKHGTFLESPGSLSDSSEPTRAGARLSPSRTASVPRKLRHFDLLTIGSTTLQVHIHEDQLPCVACSPIGGDEIPLFPPNRIAQDSLTLKRSREAAEMDTETPRPGDPKKALAMLKRTLLTRHGGDSSPNTTPQQSERGRSMYVDRSARRRALQHHSHSRGLSTPKSDTQSRPPSQPSTPPIETLTETSQPPAPLPVSNIGHRLLTKQGWQPGTSLGLPGSLAETEGRIGLVEPLWIGSTAYRVGLGGHRERAPASDSAEWREIAKRKRWKNSVFSVLQ